MIIYHNSHRAEYRRPFGAVKTDGALMLALDIKDEPDIRCSLVIFGDGEAPQLRPMLRDGDRFSLSLTVPNTAGLLWYYFLISSRNEKTVYYGNKPDSLGGEGQVYETNPVPYQITVYEDGAPAEWYRQAIVYQIFPDRFNRGSDWELRRKNAERDPAWQGPSRVFQESWKDKPFYTKNPKGEVTRWPFFGGTLEGIREKLLYLKSLGVSVIYLNPIFEASSNHKYDTADYFNIDPAFGDEESFKALISSAGSLGIYVILDGVFSHTGADSRYFNRYGNYGDKGACQGEASPYFKWFNFESFPDKYDCWWGVADLPTTDKNNADFQRFIYGKDGVIKHWLKSGIGGWRLDVADELPDSFIRGIRQAMSEEKPGSILIGEVWEDASNKISYGKRRKYLLGGALDSVMNYPLRRAALDYMSGKASAYTFSAVLMSLKENYPPQHFSAALNLIGSHDRARILTRLGDAPDNLTELEKEHYLLPKDKYSLAKLRLKLLSLLQFSLPGVPCIYYGDEAGVQGFEDPFNRGSYPWGNEDKELLEHYRFLGLLRRQFKALENGAFSIEGLTEHVLLIRRRSEDEEILILINRGIFEHESVALNTDSGFILNLLNSRLLHSLNRRLELRLEPLSARVLYLSEASLSQPRLLKPERAAGILCHITSIPCPDNSLPTIEAAYRFIDFLYESGQKLWQLLPLNPAGKGGSPFYSPSVFALGKFFTDTELCIEEDGFNAFCKENGYWLDDYCLFMSLSDKNHNMPWQTWPPEERTKKQAAALSEQYKSSILSHRLEQYRRQLTWEKVKNYAFERGISIIGDLPIYASPEGADTWAHPELFTLTEEGQPYLHAAVPPDYFNEEGQDWGNPLYNWDTEKAALLSFWEHRFRRILTHCDIIRLDHFRSFSAYFAVPDKGKPKDGYWLSGAGIDFFREMRRRIGSLPFIAEDLGVLDTGVYNLLKLSGLRGMNVWQFSESEIRNMPEEEALQRVFYSGTHDNQTLLGWCSDNNRDNGSPVARAKEIIEELYAAKAPWVITPLQDVLFLGDEARMNLPGTAEGNWSWKAASNDLSQELSSWLKNLAEVNKRI